MSSSFGRGVKPTPPDRGSFPLDHDGTCKDIAKDYLACIKASNGNALMCRKISAKYMKCRIENNLLADEPLTHLGFRESDIQPDIQKNDIDRDNSVIEPRSERKEERGFVSGVSLAESYPEKSLVGKLLSKFIG